MASGSFSAEFLGMPELKKALDELGSKAEVAAREAVTKAASIAEASIKEQFQGAHPRGAPHVGGSGPNVVSGRLRASVHADPVTKRDEGWGTFVGPRMIYGRRVELGWRGVGAYPYTTPGFLKAKPLIAAAQSIVVRTHLLGG